MKAWMSRCSAGVAMWMLGAAVCSVTACAATLEPASELAAQPSGGQPQVKDELFAGTEKFAANATDVTDVNLDRSMLGALSGKSKDASMAGQMNFIVVHSYTYDKPGMYRTEDVEAYQKKLVDGNWSCFIHTRERKSGEATDICSRNHGDSDTHELVIITAEPKELTFVHLSGRMSLSQLKMMGEMGAMGGGMNADMLMNMPAPPAPPAPPPPPAPPASAPKAPGGKQKPQEQMLNDLQQQLRDAQAQVQQSARIDVQQALRDAEARLHSTDIRDMQQQLLDAQKGMQQLAASDTQQRLQDAEKQMQRALESVR